MKKVFCITLFLGLLGACEKLEYEAYTLYNPPIVLEFNEDVSSKYYFECEADTSYVTFKSNYVWMAEVEKNAQSWLTVSPAEGKQGEWKIAFIVKKNGLNNRAGDIIISAKDTDVVFTINQSACTNE